MRYMKTNELTITQVANELGMSHDMITRWWRKGIIQGRKKNPFARNSPVLIPESELKKIKKVLDVAAKS